MHGLEQQQKLPCIDRDDNAELVCIYNFYIYNFVKICKNLLHIEVKLIENVIFCIVYKSYLRKKFIIFFKKNKKYCP